MSFVSVCFLFFLPAVFLLYWGLNRHQRWQNMFLVVASYVFYGWWDYRFLFLIFLTSLSSYVTGMMIAKSCGQRQRYWTATANIVFNLLILLVFKYYNFFIDSLQVLASSVGFLLDVPTLYLILPVGISFYTFQSLSYTIDVYKGKVKATPDVVAFFAYICFFPQLVAGPIERATNLLPQMLNTRRFDYDDAVDGLRQVLWGFFKKMVIADQCALAVNMVWDDWWSQSAIMLLVSMVLFSFQIYGDFSGYSDIAIGTAKLFGIHLNDNFRLPYFSHSIAEFWRRWHISLMSWFRDYVYIPLGGSLGTRMLAARNTIIVFLLSGLWHGANWTFVVWGAYNAVLFLPSLLLGKKNKRHTQVPSLLDVPAIILTFLFVAFGWVFFRADTLGAGLGYLHLTFISVVHGSWGAMTAGKGALLWCCVLIVIEWLTRRYRHPLQIVLTWPPVVRWSVYYVLLLCVIFFHGEEQTFIYFQF